MPTERACAADWPARHEYKDLPELAPAQGDAEGEQGSQGATPRSTNLSLRSQGDTPRSDGSDMRTASDD